MSKLLSPTYSRAPSKVKPHGYATSCPTFCSHTTLPVSASSACSLPFFCSAATSLRGPFAVCTVNRIGDDPKSKSLPCSPSQLTAGGSSQPLFAPSPCVNCGDQRSVPSLRLRASIAPLFGHGRPESPLPLHS